MRFQQVVQNFLHFVGRRAKRVGEQLLRSSLTITVNGRFKNENRSLLLDAPTIEMLAKVVNVRMDYYNDVRRHSVLNNQPPRRFLECWLRDVNEERLSSEPSLRTTLKPEI